MISAEKIKENWDTHINLIKKFIREPRASKVLEMYSDLEEVMVMLPASGKTDFHNAFPGGYVDHVNRVVLLSFHFSKLWEKMGAKIDFSSEELAFSALMHDLGKVGYKDNPGYVKQDDKWRQDKLGEIYKSNDSLSFMLAQDRSLFTLQKYGIECTENEFIAIKTHDGLYDDTNKPYYISYRPESKFRTNLPLILHQADLAAAKIEYDLYP